MPAPQSLALPALAAGLVVALACPGVARADRIASTGYFAEGGVGAAVPLGVTADAAVPGPTFEVRAGYEVMSWLATGVQLAASTHEATVPPPPVGEYFQLYRGGADIRMGGLFGSVGVFVEGGVGVALISSNILEKVQITEPGERLSLYVTAGAGVEYQLKNRHYALGIAGGWMDLLQFAQSQGISTRAYLRYTY